LADAGGPGGGRNIGFVEEQRWPSRADRFDPALPSTKFISEDFLFERQPAEQNPERRSLKI